jgi:argininosuccinate lyase
MKQKKTTIVGEIDPAVLEYTAGKDVVLDRVLVEADCIGSAAHATMLAALPVEAIRFSQKERDAIVAELVTIMRQSRAGKFRITERDQDVHLAVERALTKVLGDLGKRIHTCRSRNDQVAVDLRLFGKEQLLGLEEAVLGLVKVLVKLAKRYEMVPLVGRTHLQPAMPSSVGVWATAYAEGLLEDLELLQTAYRLTDRCPLGAAAGYGVPLPIDRELTSRVLGFERPIQSVMQAGNARGKCEAITLEACAQVMTTLSRLSEDVILFSMPEFGYFELPREYCTGSSIMPQKSNPDVFELIRGRSAKVMGLAHWAGGVIKGLSGGYNRDLQETKEPYMEGLSVTLASVNVAAKVLDGMRVDGAACRAGFDAGVFATDRALELVAGGMPFREAYHQVKGELGDLADYDPDEAIRRKTHLGAPAGLNLDFYRSEVKSGLAFVRKRRTRYYSAVSKLLGVRYPDLSEK